MKTLIRLLLEEQSDLGLHCLPRPICAKTKGHYGTAMSESEVVHNMSHVMRKPVFGVSDQV